MYDENNEVFTIEDLEEVEELLETMKLAEENVDDRINY